MPFSYKIKISPSLSIIGFRLSFKAVKNLVPVLSLFLDLSEKTRKNNFDVLLEK